MDFITQNKQIIDILQKLLNNDCLLCGSIKKILVNHDLSDLRICYPEDKEIDFLALFDDIKQFKYKQLSETETLWIINDIEFTTTNKLNKNDVYISKNGISIIGQSKQKSIDVLKYFRVTESEDCDRMKVTISWLKYLMNADNYVYGSWPTRYILNDCSDCDENNERDIDLCTTDKNKIRQLMTALECSGICQIDNNVGKYDIKPLNARIKLEGWNLIFDIHEESKNMSCDAFYNNLKLTNDYVTINYEPDNLSFIESLILTFNDLFYNQYTLIKPIPNQFQNKSDFRLLLKPFLFSTTKEISYDYLEENDQNIRKLNDVVTDHICEKHKNSDNLEYPIMNMCLNMNKEVKKSWCLNCIQDHVLQKK